MASGKKSKKLRRQVFGRGKDAKEAFRNRRHTIAPKDGKLVSDPLRRIYQKAKNAMKGL